MKFDNISLLPQSFDYLELTSRGTLSNTAGAFEKYNAENDACAQGRKEDKNIIPMNSANHLVKMHLFPWPLLLLNNCSATRTFIGLDGDGNNCVFENLFGCFGTRSSVLTKIMI